MRPRSTSVSDEFSASASPPARTALFLQMNVTRLAIAIHLDPTCQPGPPISHSWSRPFSPVDAQHARASAIVLPAFSATQGAQSLLTKRKFIGARWV